MSPDVVSVAPSADGQPRILIMPRLTWSSTCGRNTCAHERCWQARERAFRRCALCDQPIEAGQRYTESRDAMSGMLFSQQHVQCPAKGAA